MGRWRYRLTNKSFVGSSYSSLLLSMNFGKNDGFLFLPFFYNLLLFMDNRCRLCSPLCFLKTRGASSSILLKSLSVWLKIFCSTSFLGLFLGGAIFGCIGWEGGYEQFFGIKKCNDEAHFSRDDSTEFQRVYVVV